MTRVTRAQWAERVRQWKASGLTSEAFAVRKGLNKSTLLWWSSRLRVEAKASLRRQEPAPAFVEVKLPAPHSEAADSVFEIELCNGIRVRLGGHVDTSQLQRVLAVLECR
jgi:hypothetical protein